MSTDNPTPDPYNTPALNRARNLLDGAPDRIGPYRILERVGGGGMGEVYVAEQLSPIKRRVAVKIIKAGMDTRQVVARFEAERQALAMMDHPNIARVFDAGTTETGRPYFVMELVRGTPLTEFCDAHKLTTRQRIELLIPVCQAVQHAHQKGIIHRDLKPNNVLVTLHDSVPVPKVIDFGIAKATAGALTDKTIYTEFRQIIGTPAYMSPEQAEMSGLDIDTRSDIYSLGVLAYELLTGTPPFDPERLVSAGLAEIQRIIKEEDPPRPSARASTLAQTTPTVGAARGIEAKRLSPLLMGDVDWIVMKSLEKDRRRRYDSASALAADLQRHLSGEPVLAAPPTWGYRARKFGRKHKVGLTVAAALTSALLLGMTTTTVFYYREAEQRQLATTQRAAAERATTRATAAQEAAEMEAYIANLSLAVTAMKEGHYPEARERLKLCPESLRDWEWTFLRLKSESILFTLPGAVSNAKLSPNGKMIATSGPSGISLWSSNSGEKISPTWNRESGLELLGFSPDSKLVMTWETDEPHIEETTVRIWDLEGKQHGNSIGGAYNQKWELSSHVKERVATWVDNQHILVPITKLRYQLEDVPMQLFEVGTGKLVKIAAWPYVSDINPKTGLLLGERELRTVDGRLIGQLSGLAELQKASFTRGGIDVAITSSDHTVGIYSVQGKWIVELPWVGYGAVYSSPSGKTFASPISDGYGFFEDTGIQIGELMAEPIFNLREQIYPQPKFVDDALAFAVNQASLFTVSGQAVAVARGPRLDDTAVIDFSRQHNIVLLGHGEFKDENFFGAFAGRVMGDFIMQSCSITSFERLDSPWTVIRDGDLVLAELDAAAASSRIDKANNVASHTQVRISDSGVIELSVNEQVIKTFESSRLRPLQAGLSPDGKRIVSAHDQGIRLWDTHTGRLLVAIPTRSSVRSVRFTPDGSRLLMELADGTAEIWDTRDYAARQADRDARFEEIKPARAHVLALLAGGMPADKLKDTLRADGSLSPLRKLVALEQATLELRRRERGAATRPSTVPSTLPAEARDRQ